MATVKKSRAKTEFGDFQTPPDLARRVCDLLHSRGVQPAAIVEPTCGVGGLLLAAIDQFPNFQKAVGAELNPAYLQAVRDAIQSRREPERVTLEIADFFTTDWASRLRDLPEPLLVIGNPPWVTNSALGALGSANLPDKVNSQGHKGLDALTGKSNFDISEWMLARLLEWLEGKDAVLAMLCKMSVARKVLKHGWKRSLPIGSSEILSISAIEAFGAAVEACLLVVWVGKKPGASECRVYDSLEAERPCQTIGWRGGHLMADVAAFDHCRSLLTGHGPAWRSGVKHDCAPIMELRKGPHGFLNGLGETVDVEPNHVFPLLKSSHLTVDGASRPSRWMVVTQRNVGENTRLLRESAPRLWKYLEAHHELFQVRASSIYRDRPPYSIFGVGDYSFAPWKVAISGFYKRLDFVVVGPKHERPVLLDDTGYFLPCGSREEAEFLSGLLNSRRAKEFLSAFVFWDAKRPITVDLLRRLDLAALAEESGLGEEWKAFPTLRRSSEADKSQRMLFASSWTHQT